MSDWIIGWIGEFGYFGIFLLMLLENIFPPIPSELILPFAGFVAAKGDLNFIGVLIAGTLGSIAGTLPWYLAGRLLGMTRLRWLANRYGRWFTISAAEIDWAERWFERFGYPAVLIGRLVPTIRTLISVPAGLAAMPFMRFIFISTIGTFVWTALLTILGYVLFEHYEQVEIFLDPATKLIVGAVVVLYIYRLVTWRPSTAQ